MRLQILIGLILCNLVWSAHPLMGKLVLEDFSPAEAAWLRYTGALLTFGFARICFKSFFKNNLAFVRKKSDRSSRLMKDWLLLVFLGGMAFCFSPLLQLTGLQSSRATDNALIIAMEPMVTVFLACLILRQSITRNYILSFILALMGFLLLTGLSFQGLDLNRSHLMGNLIMLISLLGEAVYSVAGADLIQRDSPLTIYGWANLFGVTILTLMILFLFAEGPLEILIHLSQHIHWRSALGLLWLGPLGTAGAYLYWMVALREARVSSLALTLFIQPVCGAILGFLFLNERLTLLQAAGGVLILTAVFSQSLSLFIKEKKVLGLLGRWLRQQ